MCSAAQLCLFAAVWSVALQACLSMAFYWQEYWSGLPFPSPGDFSDPGFKPMSPLSPALAGGFFNTAPPAAAAAAKLLQSCPTLCDPKEGSPPGSPIPGILQAKTLEWIAIAFSTAPPGKPQIRVDMDIDVLVEQTSYQNMPLWLEDYFFVCKKQKFQKQLLIPPNNCLKSLSLSCQYSR